MRKGIPAASAIRRPSPARSFRLSAVVRTWPVVALAESLAVRLSETVRARVAVLTAVSLMLRVSVAVRPAPLMPLALSLTVRVSLANAASNDAAN